MKSMKETYQEGLSGAVNGAKLGLIKGAFMSGMAGSLASSMGAKPKHVVMASVLGTAGLMLGDAYDGHLYEEACKKRRKEKEVEKSRKRFRIQNDGAQPVHLEKPDGSFLFLHPEHYKSMKEDFHEEGYRLKNTRNSESGLKDHVELKDHQKRVAEKIEKYGGVLAFHGMGSGKSLTSINAMMGKKPDVIVPASLRTNYVKEIEKHTTGHPVNIKSYEKAVKDEVTSRALVMDEPQALGNVGSLRTQTLMRKAKEYDKRLLMTGTPIRNYPHEIAPLLNIVKGEKTFPTDEKAFNEKFIKEIEVDPGFFARHFKGAQMGIEKQMKNQKYFEDLVRGHVDYHMPDHKDFPSSTREIIPVEMSKNQQDAYDYAISKAGPAVAYKIRKGLPPSKQELASLNSFMSATRQISNTGHAYGVKGVSPKISKAVENLKAKHDSDPNFRGVVYSNYLDSGINPYARELDKHGITYHTFDGSMNDKEREKVVSDYNEGRVKNLLISGAGAQGLDLKGTKLVQLLEPHWNNARLEQATARAIRFKSHEHLPEEERHVHVEQYHSTIRPSFLDKVQEKLSLKKRDKSADEYLYDLSAKKDMLNNQFLDSLKKVGQESSPMGSFLIQKLFSVQDSLKEIQILNNDALVACISLQQLSDPYDEKNLQDDTDEQFLKDRVLKNLRVVDKKIAEIRQPLEDLKVSTLNGSGSLNTSNLQNILNVALSFESNHRYDETLVPITIKAIKDMDQEILKMLFEVRRASSQ